MNNIVFDFRRNYVRGERLEAQEIVYQYDEGRVIEAYVPEQEGFVLNVGFESDATLYVVEVDSTTADDEGGYKVLATLPDTFLTRHGNLLVYVIAGEDEMIVTTYEGVVPVLPKAVSEDYVEPTEEESSILARCAAAANASETAQGAAEAKALVAEGYALGTQDGTPVSSGTYYQNNAKYHELEAEGYAVGKQDGTDVSSGSPYYHNNAKYYAEQTAESLNGVLWQTDIVDNATTSDTTKVPSAAVAKSLQDQIGTVPSGSTLQGQIDTLNSKYSTTTTAQISWTSYSAQGSSAISRVTKCAQGLKVDFCATYTLDIPAGTKFANLPTGYRPSADYVLPAIIVTSSNVVMCSYVVVQTDGYIYQNDTNVARKIYIDGFIYQ